MTGRELRAGFAGTLLLVGALAPGASAAPQEPPPAATDDFSERVDVEVVNVDVVVTGACGHRGRP